MSIDVFPPYHRGSDQLLSRVYMTETQPLGDSGPLSVGLSVTCIIWYLAIWSLSLLGCNVAYVPSRPRRIYVHKSHFSRKRYRRRPRSPLAADSNAPGVSILRPLKGLENNLYENLEATFRQDYLNYEIFFCVADHDDQALPVVQDLIAKYPRVRATVVTGIPSTLFWLTT